LSPPTVAKNCWVLAPLPAAAFTFGLLVSLA
jgi:hypothetical protein